MTGRIILFVFILAACGIAKAGDESPRYFGASPGALAEVKARLAAHDESLQPALNTLLRAADRRCKSNRLRWWRKAGFRRVVTCTIT